MRIALLGSAPSSIRLAPFGDARYQIWACSPGTYAHLPRCDAFFELHRWEPGEVGKPQTQKPWLSPEYVAWMGQQKLVWMADKVPEIPGSQRLPIEMLLNKYGSYFFTSSIAYMMAMAMDLILAARVARTVEEEDVIGLWGVDMAATEEYGYQRAGCHHFLGMASQMGIDIEVPPESDLLIPMPLYGLCESSHWHIKNLARKKELEARLANAQNTQQVMLQEVSFLKGALDDLTYQMDTWSETREGIAPSFPIVIQSEAKAA